MKRLVPCALVLTLEPTAMAAKPNPEPPPTFAWTFDGDRLQQPPVGFVFGMTGKGRAGQWEVQDQNGAPSPSNVLVQTDSDPSRGRVPFALPHKRSFQDLRLRVKCKPQLGGVEKSCGLVARWQGDRRYYGLRLSALKGDLLIYAQDGDTKHELVRKPAACKVGEWHTLEFTLKGEALEAKVGGKVVAAVKDGKLKGAGQFGVATDGDALTYFDDLEVWRL
jgi:hypothetical protein